MRRSQQDFSAPPMGNTASELRKEGASWSGFEANELFVQDGKGHFDRVSGVSGVDTVTDTRTHVLLDIDRDGFQDIALVNSNAPKLQLFRNRIGELRGTGAGGFIAVRFVGASRSASAEVGKGNRSGIGAKVLVHLADGRVLRRDHQAGEGFAALNSPTRLIGLGGLAQADKVVVRWPSGSETAIEAVAEGSLLTAWEDATQAPDGNAFTVEPYRPGARVQVPAEPAVGATPQHLPAGIVAAGKAPLRLFVTMASWCEACASEVPALHAIRSAIPAKELDIIGIAVDAEDTPEKLAQWMAKHQPPYALAAALDAPARGVVEGFVQRGLGAQQLPAALITDATGRVLDVIGGRPTLSDVRAAQAENAAAAPPVAPEPEPAGDAP